MPVLNINTDSLIVLVNKLEKMHKSDLPVVINKTLNSAALDVKQVTMLQNSKAQFTNRTKTFFKAKSRVQFSKGFNINNQKSIVGFKDFGTKSPAVENLRHQEHGTRLKQSASSTDSSRISKSNFRRVKKQHRTTSIRGGKGKITDVAIDALSHGNKGKNDKMKLIRAVMFFANNPVSKGAYVLGSKRVKNNKRIFYQIKTAKKVGENGVNIKLLPLYSYKDGASFIPRARGRHFMRNASLRSAKKLGQFFIREAKIRIRK